ncbi:laccase domain-containing protein [Spirochaeta dissipatitropha]
MNIKYREIDKSARIISPDSELIGIRLDFPLPFFLSSIHCGDLGIERSGSLWCGRKGNRAAVLEYFGADPAHTMLLRQVHSRDIVCFNRSVSESAYYAADGIWGTKSELLSRDAAAVTVADCMPIAVYEHKSESWAILHSGRKGTGILLSALEMIRDYAESSGISGCQYTVCFGPCISAENYPLDDDSAIEFQSEWGQCAAVRLENGQLAADLRAANIEILHRFLENNSALEIKDVIVYTDCTYSHVDLGSFRREGVEKFTRMIALVRKDSTR